MHARGGVQDRVTGPCDSQRSPQLLSGPLSPQVREAFTDPSAAGWTPIHPEPSGTSRLSRRSTRASLLDES